MADPRDESDDRPWERPSAVRRDCEPHRGQFLLTLGTVSLACGLLSIWLIATAPVALPLAVVVRVVSSRDLREIRAGHLDPAGRVPLPRSRAAARRAILAVVLGVMSWGIL